MTTDELINTLLEKRGLTTPELVYEFFHPAHPEELPLGSSGLSEKAVSAAIQLIKSHLKADHPIAVYGDYDVDGMCSTAILWEILYHKDTSPQVFPYIPHRRNEGYGLSIAGMDACLAKGAKLIITVDNGIVAHKQIKYARDHGCDVIIIDHHEPEGELPQANIIVHSTATCAAALTWFFTREYQKSHPLPFSRGGLGRGLELVSLAIVCDLIPLLGINRSLVLHGLEQMRRTTRPGLLALFTEAAVDPSKLEAYHLGFIIGPRLNAMGRLEHAIDSLRLLCTRDLQQAEKLAHLLGDTNRSRQDLTADSTEAAIAQIESRYPKLQQLPKLLIVADPSYDEGVIGLIAAKLVEKFHRPAIALSVGAEFSKASARSVPGFHITDYLRTVSHLLTGVGGHAMAAGFTVPNANLDELQDLLVTTAHDKVTDDLLVRQHRVDVEVPLSILDLDLVRKLKTFAPFGLGNPQPVFYTPAVSISNPRHIGKSCQHLKFTAGHLDAVAFNYPVDPPASADLYYQIDANEWNGRVALQLIVKHLEPSHGPSA